jgi:hypothetical protein
MFRPSALSNPLARSNLTLQRIDATKLATQQVGTVGLRRSEQVEEILNKIQEKKAGVPLWVWGLAGASAVGIAVFLARKSKKRG